VNRIARTPNLRLKHERGAAFGPFLIYRMTRFYESCEIRRLCRIAGLLPAKTPVKATSALVLSR